MKKYVLILLVGLLCCQLSGFAEGTISPTDSTTIYIDPSDTSIIYVRYHFKDICLYGDIADTVQFYPDDKGALKAMRYVRYGGDGNDYDQIKKKTVNRFFGAIERLDTTTFKYIAYDKDLGINLISCNLPDSCSLYFYGAKYVPEKGQEWCLDKDHIYKLTVVKKTQNPCDESGDGDNNKDDGFLGSLLQNSEPIFSLGDFDITLPILLECIAVFAVISLFVLIFARINSLNKKLNRLNTDVKVKEHESGIPGKDIYAVINGSDVQAYIKKIIAKSTEDYIQSRKPVFAQPEIDVVKIKEVILAQVKSEIQTIIAGQIENYLQNRQSVSEQPAVEKPSQISEIKQPEFRTTKVQYYPDSNSFIISENSQNEIFELYSENGEYYYTIVNDPVLRKEMLGILPSYRQCIEIRQDSPTISDVEVIRDGKLIKNGDVYNIDSGCVLQLSLK